ncbi:MAG: septum formation initiator family protein [Candidatus Omnitrophica bacterium]|nr:septum formation initiator family protein [Candidatus Omnitrophota bacterium]
MRLNWWKLVLWLIVLFIIFLPVHTKLEKLKAKDTALSQELKSLTAENKQLAQEIEMLKNDPVYIEEIARDKLKVARENEIVFRVIEDRKD